jgi:hypothetical protein
MAAAKKDKVESEAEQKQAVAFARPILSSRNIRN